MLGFDNGCVAACRVGRNGPIISAHSLPIDPGEEGG